MPSLRVLPLVVLLTALGLLVGAALAPASPALAQDGGTPVPSPGTPEPPGTPPPPQVINHYLRFQNSVLEDAIVGITNNLAVGLNTEAEQAYGNALDKLVFHSVYGIAAPPGGDYAGTALLRQIKPGWDASLTLALALMPLVLALLAVDKLRRAVLSTLSWAELKEAIGEWFLAGAAAAASFYVLSLAHTVSKWFAVWIFSIDFSGGQGDAALTGLNLAGAFFFASALGTVGPTVIVYLVFFALFLGAAILISLILAVAAYIAMMALLTLVAPLVIVLGVLPPLGWLRDIWLKGTLMALLVPVVNVTLLKLSYGIATNISLDSIGGYIARAATLAGAISILLSLNFKAGQIMFGAISAVHDEMRATLTGLGSLALGAVALVASAGTLAPGLLGAGAAAGGATGAAGVGSAAAESAASGSTAAGLAAPSAASGAAAESRAATPSLSMNGRSSGEVAAATRSAPRARERAVGASVEGRGAASAASHGTATGAQGQVNGSEAEPAAAAHMGGAPDDPVPLAATAGHADGSGPEAQGDSSGGRLAAQPAAAEPDSSLPGADSARRGADPDRRGADPDRRGAGPAAPATTGALAVARQARATQLVRAAGRLLGHAGHPALRALGDGLATGADMAQAQHRYEAALGSRAASATADTPATDLGDTAQGRLGERRAELNVARQIAAAPEAPPPPAGDAPAPAWYAGTLSRSLQAAGQRHDLHDALDVTHLAHDGLRRSGLEGGARAQGAAHLASLYQNPRLGASPERFKQAHAAWAHRYQVTLGGDFDAVADRLFGQDPATPAKERP